MKLLDFFRKRAPSDSAYALYGAIVAQARREIFYSRYGVPDTVDGRFDMIVLHLIVLFHRFRSEDEMVRAFGQEVFDVFCTDMDRNLREMGVADITVPKKIKKMINAFYGRLERYVGAIDSGDRAALAEGIRRNLFPGAEDHIHPEPLAGYVLASVEALKRQTVETLRGGTADFADPGLFAPGSPEAGAP